VGQELTARVKYRNLVKRRLAAVGIIGILPPLGAPITVGSTKVGEMRSGYNGFGLALLHLDAVNQPLTVCNAELVLRHSVNSFKKRT
jgi:folate-binding Fe-S cluster repair protein YgfZ